MLENFRCRIKTIVGRSHLSMLRLVELFFEIIIIQELGHRAM